MMDAEARRALLEHAIRLYGEPAQMDMAVEEMAELTKAICKVKRASCAAPPRRSRRQNWNGWPEGCTPDTSKTE